MIRSLSDVRTSFAEAWEAAREIDGWLAPEQARLLWDRARRVPAGGCVVEIGSHHGKSMCVLASAATDGVRLVAIDPFDDPRWGGGADALHAFEASLDRLGLRDRVEMRRGLSTEVLPHWDGTPIDLLYVDGAHDRPTVLADLRGWGSNVRPGGDLLIHDTFSSVGVTQAVLEHFGRRGSDFEFVERARTLALFVRLPPGARAAAVRRARLVGQLPYFARNAAIKVAIRRGWHRVPRVLGHHEQGYPY